MTLLQESSMELQKKYKEVSRRYYLYIPIVCLVLLAAFIDLRLCAVAIVLSLGYQLIYLRRKRQEYSALFNHYHILLGMENQMEGLQHTHLEGVSREDILKARLIPVTEKDKCLLTREHTIGLAKGLPVELCDATFCYQYKSGRQNRGYCVSGCWSRIELPTFTGCDWRLIEKDVLNELARRSYFSAFPELERAQVGVEWVDQKYYFYRPKGSDEKPDALLLKQLKLLQEYTPGRICISLCGNLFQVFIQNRVLSRNVSLAATLTVQQISACPFPELEYLVRMARLITRQEQEVLVPAKKQEEPAASQPQKAAQPAEEGEIQEKEEDKDQA